MPLKTYIVKRPFKAANGFHPAGEVITDPAGIRLFKLKVSDGAVLEVTEQNLDRTADYFAKRFGLDVRDKLKEALQRTSEEEKPKDKTDEEAERLAYIERVKAFAAKYGVEMEGRELDEVVAEIKQKQAEATKPTE